MVNKSESQVLLASVAEEMAKPRLALSARTYFRSHVMTINPKFHKGEIVHNRFANEDGKVMGSYDKEGICMYEVSVVIPFPREHPPYSSDWAEDCLEPFDKTTAHHRAGDAPGTRS